ncbi:GDP-mannose 4,6-dehydratase [Pontimonas sp.]|nr:GDP-mannose 4,6-dehydratase [Pontimonas sp.]
MRDWGYAREYVEAMWQMLQAEQPDDFVVATGTKYSVRDFLDFTFEHLGLDWKDYVELDPRFLRPAEVDSLVGDSAKIRDVTGWTPSVLPPELARIMVAADQRAVESGVAFGEDRGLSEPHERGL